jgi:SNF2 family DNA or RNA helicase
MSAEDWILEEPCQGVQLVADERCIRFRSNHLDLTDTSVLAGLNPVTRLGRLLPSLFTQLRGMELLAVRPDGLSIDYADFAGLEEREIDAFDGIWPWSPFTLQLSSSGWLQNESFRYFTGFYLGTQKVSLTRRGCFVRRSAVTYRLDNTTFLLLEAIQKFEESSSDERTSSRALIEFAQIKGLAREVGAQLDQLLEHENVLVPSRIGLDIRSDDAGRITFAPKVDGVPGSIFQDAFLALDDVDDVYSCEVEGKKVRVVLDGMQQEVLRRMQRIRHVGGPDRAAVLRDPTSLFDGVSAAVEIDMKEFGPRVKGIGDFPFVAQPYLQRSTTGIFDDPEAPDHQGSRPPFKAGLEVRYQDGKSERIEFKSKSEISDVLVRAKDAWRQGAGEIHVQGKSVVVDESLLRSLEQLKKVTNGSKNRDPSGERRNFLLIYRNFEDLEYEETESGAVEVSELRLPAALQMELKAHQREGVAWLQRNFLLKRRGCLLADDMGLGKTLQILTFLAWLIERGEIFPSGSDGATGPYDPILVVAPIILLENETWLRDARGFFRGSGAIFEPCVTLHGNRLKEFRRPDLRGPETKLGEPSLDLEMLRSYRLVFTNYETVTNYQHSFAKMKDHWAVVVTDEAQEHKTPDSKISHALKTLSPRFRIASTGTPVETKLLDVWNIFDFLHPGLLGSAAQFTKRHERPPETGPANGAGGVADLKDRLLFGRPSALLLRRDKSTALKDLPAKHEHRIYSDLTPEQRRWHVDLIQKASAEEDRGHPFALISQLMRLYEHAALVPRYEPIPPADAIARSPKLTNVLKCLDAVRKKGEKALVFTRSTGMQELLHSVMRYRFELDADIINGVTPRAGSPNWGKRDRKAIIKAFQESVGFNVLILSPEVAGTGLTLVEANHVIHYGRWWNPARESQATDRAYRIGQTKDMHVYYPISLDPEKRFDTFDQKLDALIERRKVMAADFLAPMPSTEELGNELTSTILGQTFSGDSPATSISAGDLPLLSWDRFEALAAVLAKREGGRVILTPRCADEGIDVVSFASGTFELMQCKHTQTGAQIDADVIAEVLQATDGYRLRRLKEFRRVANIRPVLVTNGRLTRRARAEANDRDIKVVELADLSQRLERFPCTRGDLEAMNSRRISSMSDFRAAVLQIITGQ